MKTGEHADTSERPYLRSEWCTKPWQALDTLHYSFSMLFKFQCLEKKDRMLGSTANMLLAFRRRVATRD